MTKTYITCASHWSCPGVRQIACATRLDADIEARRFTNELVDDWALEDKGRRVEAWAPPLAVNNWEPTLRALQLKRLIDYLGGEGEANDALDAATSRSSDKPPLLGLGFTPELQHAIQMVVEADEREDPDAQIGFPMVWIEEVETDHQPPEVVEPDIAMLHGICGFAEQFTTDWFETTDTDEDRERAARACTDVERASVMVAKLGKLLPVLEAALSDALGSIDALGHQVDQMRGMFGDEDGAIERAIEEAAEGREIAFAARERLRAMRAGDDEPKPKPIRVCAVMDGGLIHEVYADRAGVVFETLDYDVEGISGSDDEPLYLIPQPDGSTTEGYKGGDEPVIDPQWFERLDAAPRASSNEDDQPFDCGQCEGTGTLQEGASGAGESCPVCDGMGALESGS